MRLNELLDGTRERPAIAIVTVCEPALILVSKVSCPQPVTLDMQARTQGGGGVRGVRTNPPFSAKVIPMSTGLYEYVCAIDHVLA